MRPGFTFFFALRLAGRGSRPISRLAVRLAVVSLTLGIAILQISASIIHGFEREIQQKIISFSGDIQLTAYYPQADDSLSLISAKSLAELPKKFPAIASAEPFINREGVMKSARSMEGVVMKGVGTPRNEAFFQKYLVEGKMPVFPDSGYGREVLLSRKTADRLEVKAGEKVKIYFLEEGRVRMRPLTVSGIYNTGLTEYDEVTVVCDLRLLQRILNAKPDLVQGFDLRIKNRNKALVADLSEQIDKAIPFDMSAEPIEERALEWFQWLELQHRHLFFIFIALTVVAIINLSATVIILISERTAMIGLLKTLGADSGTVRKIFLWNAFLIMVPGVILGNVLGLGLLALQDLTGIFKMDSDSYFVSTVPVSWVWETFGQINLLFVGVCMVFMLLPVLVISGIRPATSLKAGQ